MGAPATTLEINELLKAQPQYGGLNSREVLATILRDQHTGGRKHLPSSSTSRAAQTLQCTKPALSEDCLAVLVSKSCPHGQ